jgi:hypothetical protein
MNNHATREELNRAYKTFERSIDKLSQVLDKHAEKQTEAYNVLDQKIKEQAQESKIKALELESRLKALENERLVHETQRELVIKIISKFPKTTVLLIILSIGGAIKMVEDVSLKRDQAAVSLQSTSSIKPLNKTSTQEVT